MVGGGSKIADLVVLAELKGEAFNLFVEAKYLALERGNQLGASVVDAGAIAGTDAVATVS